MADKESNIHTPETSYEPFTFDDCDLAPIVRSIPMRGDAWVSRNALHVTALGVLLVDTTAELVTIEVNNGAVNLAHYTRIHCLDIDDDTGVPVYYANDAHQGIFSREALADRFMREPEIPQDWRSQGYSELVGWAGNIIQLDSAAPDIERTYNYVIPGLNVADYVPNT